MFINKIIPIEVKIDLNISSAIDLFLNKKNNVTKIRIQKYTVNTNTSPYNIPIPFASLLNAINTPN